MPDEMPAHRLLQMSQCIAADGLITRQNLSSVNKQVRPVGSDE
jgi:hypothetical protein